MYLQIWALLDGPFRGRVLCMGNGIDHSNFEETEDPHRPAAGQTWRRLHDSFTRSRLRLCRAGARKQAREWLDQVDALVR